MKKIIVLIFLLSCGGIFAVNSKVKIKAVEKGNIQINTLTLGKIYVNGKNYGETALILGIQTGVYKVRIEYDNGNSEEKNGVIVEKDKTAEVTFGEEGGVKLKPVRGKGKNGKYIPTKKYEIYPKQFFKGDKITIYFSSNITGKMKKEKKIKDAFYNPTSLNIYYGFNGWDEKTLVKKDYEMKYDASIEYFSYELVVPKFADKINVVFKDNEGNSSEDFETLVPNKNILGKDGKKVELVPEEFYKGDKVIVYFTEKISGKMKKERSKLKSKNPDVLSEPNDVFIHYGFNNWDPQYAVKEDPAENYSDLMMYNPKTKKYYFEIEIPNFATELNLSFKDEFDNYSEDFAFQVYTKLKDK